MIILRCRRCNGTGQVTSEQYKICEALKSHEAKRYFHLPMEGDTGDSESHTHDACEGVPEKVTCPVCEGNGEIAFDEEDWELAIADEDDEQSDV